MALDFRTYEQKHSKKLGGLDYENAPMPVQIGGMMGKWLQGKEDWAVDKFKDKWQKAGGWKGIGDWIKSPLDVTDLKEPSAVRPSIPVDEGYGHWETEDMPPMTDVDPEPTPVDPSLLTMAGRKKESDQQASFNIAQKNRVGSPGFDHFASAMLVPESEGGIGGALSEKMQEQLGLSDVFGTGQNQTIASQLTNKENLKKMFGVDGNDYDEMEEFYGYFTQDGALDYNKLSDKHRDAFNLKVWQRLGSNKQDEWAGSAKQSAGTMAPVNVTAPNLSNQPEYVEEIDTNEPLAPSMTDPSGLSRQAQSDMQADLEAMSSMELESPKGRKLAKDLGLSQEDYWNLYQQYAWEEDPANQGKDYPGSNLSQFPGLLGKMMGQSKGGPI